MMIVDRLCMHPETSLLPVDMQKQRWMPEELSSDSAQVDIQAASSDLHLTVVTAASYLKLTPQSSSAVLAIGAAHFI